MIERRPVHHRHSKCMNSHIPKPVVMTPIRKKIAASAGLDLSSCPTLDVKEMISAFELTSALAFATARAFSPFSPCFFRRKFPSKNAGIFVQCFDIKSEISRLSWFKLR
jgi:hypothetical protein